MFLGIATLFEGYGTFAVAQVLPEVRDDLSLSVQDAGVLIGAISLGSVLSFFLVRAADRVGRRRVLLLAMFGLGLFAALSGASHSFWTFALTQFLARVFLTAEWGLVMVIAAEEFPAARRATVMGAFTGLNGVGAVACAGIAPLLLSSSIGWRFVFFIGAIPMLLAVLGWCFLRETRRFSTQSADVLKSPPRAFLILRRPYRKPMLQMAAIWALTYACAQNAITFWKEHATSELNASSAEVGTNVSIAALVAMPLAFSAGRMVDRLGRRVGALLIYAALVAGVLGSYLLQERIVVVLSLVLAIASVAAVNGLLAAYNAELFPTELRADAFGWSNQLVGRSALVVSPIVVGFAADRIGWAQAVSWTVLFPMVALVLVIALLPETRGQELEVTSLRGSALRRRPK